MPVVQDYTAILSGSSINETTGKGAFYTFSFLTSVPSDYYGNYSDAALATFRSLTEAERTAARQALDAWAAISGLTLFEVPSGEGDIRFGAFDLSLMRAGAAGFAFYPSGLNDYSLASDVFLDANYAGNTHTLLHEIGHALGFKHTFDGNVTLDPSIDNFSSSVMSYTSGGSSGDVLGQLDRQAVQYLYGDASADGKQVASWSWNAATHSLTQTGFGTADKIGGVGSADVIFGMGGNDIVQGRGGNDQIDGGDGDDELRGGAGDDILIGGIGKDTLTGNEGKDRLEGGADNDTLYGLEGDDTLLGGAGADFLVAGGGNNRLEGGTENDTLFGDDGDDTMFGDDGNDSLNAAGGRNILSGGNGDDQMYVNFTGAGFAFQADGGAGTDTFGITILAGAAAATISIPALIAAGSTLLNVEAINIWANDSGDRITAGSGNDFVQGGALGDIVIGGDGGDSLYGRGGNDDLSGGQGNDYLQGGDGADKLNGGAGADTLEGGAGADRFVYLLATDSPSASQDYISKFETGIDKIDLSAMAGAAVHWVDHLYFNSTAHYSNVTVTLGGATMIIFVDGSVAAGDFLLTAAPIVGTSGPDILSGTGGPDTINGSGGADNLSGLGGNDILNGGIGPDDMNGGTGDDLFFVDNGGDRVFEKSGEGNDRVFATISFTLAAGQSIETLSTDSALGTAAVNLTGNELVNTIQGNAGANILNGGGADDTIVANAGNDILNGGTGIDYMNGGTGNDNFYIDNSSDKAFDKVGEGVDRVFTTVSYALLTGQEIETLSTTDTLSSFSVNLTGNELANTIIANAADNILQGKDGNDTIVGNAGNDSIYGGTGADSMNGGTGNDWFYVDNGADKAFDKAGEGNDRVLSSVAFTLAAGQEIETLSTDNGLGTGAIDLAGNESANTIMGNAGANLLDGKGGNDVLLGFGGADTFAFTTAIGAGNVDQVSGFAQGTDRIALENSVFTGLGAGALAATAFFAGAAAHDADDRIVYDSATGQLFFDADGNGAGAAVLFATFGAGTGLSASDFSVI